MATLEEFGQTIKNKYPQYKDIPNVDLANKIILKYPQYKSQITEQQKTTSIDKTKGNLNPLQRIGTQFLAGQESTERALTPESMRTDERRINIDKPKGFLEKGSKFAGEYLAPQPILGGAPGEIGFAAQQGAKILGKAISPLVKPIANLAGKTMAFTGEMLSSIPREAFERAIGKELSGDSIFKGKFNSDETFYDLGKKAQNAMNSVFKSEGKAVGEIKGLLKGDKTIIDTTPIIEKAHKEIGGITFDNLNALNADDSNEINRILELLHGTPEKTISKASPILTEKGVPFTTKKTIEGQPITLERLQGIKEEANKELSYSYGQVKKTSSQGQRILKGIVDDITNILETKGPQGLKEANANYARVAEIKNRLLNKLKPENVGRNLRGILKKDPDTLEMFKELSDLAPDKYKFYEQTLDSLAREPFENLFPGRGGGSGSAEGFANILRIATLEAGGAALFGPLKAVAALPFVSPLAQKKVIQSVGLSQKIAPMVSKTLKALPASESSPAGLLNKLIGGE